MNNFIRQLNELLKVQFKEFFREPEILFWALAFPVAMAWVLGIAFSGEAKQNFSIGIVNRTSHSADTAQYFVRRLNEAGTTVIVKDKSFSFSGYNGNDKFTLVKTTPDSASLLLLSGKVCMIINSYNDSLEYVYDSRNAEAKTAYLVLKTILNRSENEEERVVQTSIRGTRYIDFLIPGLIGLNIMSSVLWAIGYSLIEKRSKKVLRRMVATPMSKTAFLASYMIGRVLIGLFEILVLLLFAYIYFGFTITGSITAFILLYLASHICFSGIAIIIASRTEKPQFGNALINLVYLPMSICSGVFFSYSGFPEWVIPIIEKLPLTMITDGFRIICNRGGDIADVFLSLVLLTTGGIITFIVGLKMYRWY